MGETSKGDILGGSGDDLSKAQREAKLSDEHLAKSPGDDAEHTVIKGSKELGTEIDAIYSSRDFCVDFAMKLVEDGLTITGPRTAVRIKE